MIHQQHEDCCDNLVRECELEQEGLEMSAYTIRAMGVKVRQPARARQTVRFKERRCLRRSGYQFSVRIFGNLKNADPLPKDRALAQAARIMAGHAGRYSVRSLLLDSDRLAQ